MSNITEPEAVRPSLVVEAYEIENFVKRLEAIIRDAGVITMDDYQSALEGARLDAATVDMSYDH